MSLLNFVANQDPCCLGLAVLASQVDLNGVMRNGFQSLLSWISRIGHHQRGISLDERRFQSLLSWIIRIGLAAKPTSRRPSMFQSLLSWISRIGCSSPLPISSCCCGFNPCCLGLAVLALSPDYRATRKPGFNPCCLGLAVLARQPQPRSRRNEAVSILVVLD